MIPNVYHKVLPILKDRKIDIALVKDFLKIAENDFEISKLLFEQKKYSHSINNLQQCIEKLTKAYLLKMDMINKDELSKISHSTPKGFMKMLKDKGVYEISTELKNILPKTIEENKKIMQNLLDIPEEQLAKMSKDEILNFISLIKNYKEPEEMAKILAKPELVYEAFEKLYPNVSIREKIKFKDFSVVLNFGTGFKLLFPLAIISYPHYLFTKYPDKEIRPWDYDQSLGIVQVYPKIINDVEFCINSLKEILKQ